MLEDIWRREREKQKREEQRFWLRFGLLCLLVVALLALMMSWALRARRANSEACARICGEQAIVQCEGRLGGVQVSCLVLESPDRRSRIVRSVRWGE